MTEARPTYGVLTDEAFERSRKRIGLAEPQPNPPHNFEVTWDGSRHFAFGYGDDNPLFCNPDYAKGTRWGTLIAPPTFHYTMGEDAAPSPIPRPGRCSRRPIRRPRLLPGDDGLRRG
jgi:hypothetical protein